MENIGIRNRSREEGVGVKAIDRCCSDWWDDGRFDLNPYGGPGDRNSYFSSFRVSRSPGSGGLGTGTEIPSGFHGENPSSEGTETFGA